MQIAAAEPYWSSHLAQLVHITKMRREIYGRDPYQFIIWWIFSLDATALLSGSGTGDFVDTMHGSNHLPTTTELLDGSVLVGTDPLQPDEVELVPLAIELYRQMTILAAKTGRLARRLRGAAGWPGHGEPSTLVRADIVHRQQQVSELRASLKQTWRTQVPPALLNGYQENSLPRRACGIFETVSLRLSLPLQPAPPTSTSHYSDDAKAPLVYDSDTFTGHAHVPGMHHLLPHQHVAYPAHGHQLPVRSRGGPMRDQDHRTGTGDDRATAAGTPISGLSAVHGWVCDGLGDGEGWGPSFAADVGAGEHGEKYAGDAEAVRCGVCEAV